MEEEDDDELKLVTEEPLWQEAERDRGILTEYDRKYLIGDEKLEGQDERNARYRIRQRLYQSLLDIELIAEKMEIDDLSQVVDKEGIERPDVIGLLRLAYRLLQADGEVDNVMEIYEEKIGHAVANIVCDSPIEDDQLAPDQRAFYGYDTSVKVDVSSQLIAVEKEDGSFETVPEADKLLPIPLSGPILQAVGFEEFPDELILMSEEEEVSEQSEAEDRD